MSPASFLLHTPWQMNGTLRRRMHAAEDKLWGLPQAGRRLERYVEDLIELIELILFHPEPRTSTYRTNGSDCLPNSKRPLILRSAASQGKSPSVAHSSPAFVEKSRPPSAVKSRPSSAASSSPPPFAGPNASPPPFTGKASPPTTREIQAAIHVPLGVLVSYEGMSWSPAPEPAPHKRPPEPAACQCLPVPAPHKRPPEPAACQCLPVPAPHKHPPEPAACQCPPVPAPHKSAPVPAPHKSAPVPAPRKSTTVRAARKSAPRKSAPVPVSPVPTPPSRARTSRAPSCARSSQAPPRLYRLPQENCFGGAICPWP